MKTNRKETERKKQKPTFPPSALFKLSYRVIGMGCHF